MSIYANTFLNRHLARLQVLTERFVNTVFLQYRFYGATPNPKKRSDVEAPIYRKIDHEFKTSKKALAKCLQDLLNIKALEAINVSLDSKHFHNVSPMVLKMNHALYVQRGITQETIIRYPEMLTVDNAEDKLRLLAKLPYDVDTTAILVLVSKSYLIKFVYNEILVDKSNGKINLLSEYLQISPQKTCEYIASKPFLILLSPKKIESNIKTLLGYGIKPDSICKDLWVLKYSEYLITARLELAKKYDIDTMKTWMIRAQEKIFQIHIQRKADDKTILGDNSVVEYLSERLSCSIAFANYLILKQPSLKNRSLKKMKELIDFLYAQGFTSGHICRVPKILVHRLETIKKRLKQLEEQGIQIDSLSILTKSQNQYMQYYEALVKNKTKNKT